MVFLKLFLFIFFLNFCGEKKLDITPDAATGAESKEFI